MPDVILVADDDPDILRFVELNLRLEGYEVLTAVDGEQALAVAHDRVPSLVILDVMMPKLDGYQVCQRLRTESRTSGVCIIMLTAKSMSADKVLGLTAGADDYISKPFDPMELVARVKTTLRRTREMRSVSPLTGLPGNVQIESEMQRRSAINYLATVLREAMAEDQFVGHIGGDDFVALTSAEDCESLSQAIVARFDKDVKDLYDPEDATRGTVVVTDRLGRELEYPLLSVSIGAATNEHHPVKDYRELVEVATEMKSFSKKRPGSVYAIDRRGRAEDGA